MSKRKREAVIKTAKKRYNVSNTSKETKELPKFETDDEIAERIISILSNSTFLESEKCTECIDWIKHHKNPSGDEINPSEFELRLNNLLKQFIPVGKDMILDSLEFYTNVVKTFNDTEVLTFKPRSYKNDTNDVSDVTKHKFALGDWLVTDKPNGEASPAYQIVNITKNAFELDDGRVFLFDTDAENTFRLWTINDARCDDILASKDHIIVFDKLVDDKNITYKFKYCTFFPNATTESNGELFNASGWKPATQREINTIVAEIEKNGYEWSKENDAPEEYHSFEKGDWVVGLLMSPFIIVDVDGIKNIYTLENTDGSRLNILFKEEGLFHKWSWKDANNGDILKRTDGSFIIFKDFCNVKNPCFVSYCSWNQNDFEFNPNSSLNWFPDDFKPATKIEKELFLSYMSTAAYRWHPKTKTLECTSYAPGTWIVSSNNPVKVLKTSVYTYNTIDTHGWANGPYKVERPTKRKATTIDVMDLFGKTNTLSNDEYNKTHIWTLNDAKSGDVLISKQFIVIFKKKTDDKFTTYLSIDLETNKITANEDEWLYPSEDFVPATHIQRDTLLLDILNKNGFEWDWSRKKLIRKKSNDDESKKESEGILENAIKSYIMTNFINDGDCLRNTQGFKVSTDDLTEMAKYISEWSIDHYDEL